MNRREFVRQAGLASLAWPVMAAAAARAQAPVPGAFPVRVDMTDWNLGRRGDITKVALERERSGSTASR